MIRINFLYQNILHTHTHHHLFVLNFQMQMEVTFFIENNMKNKILELLWYALRDNKIHFVRLQK